MLTSVHMRALPLLFVAACSGQATPPTHAPFHVVAVGTQEALPQLISGFHEIKDFWRWTAGSFVVELGVPVEPYPRAVVLTLDGSYPEVSWRHHGPASLQCAVGDAQLAPEQVSAVGSVHMERDLPSIPKSATVRVACTITPTIPPSSTDAREYGLAVSLIGLRAR